MLLRIGALLSSSVGTGEGGAGIRPGVAAMSWTGYPPTITGVTFSFAPGVGSATWTGQTPTLQVPVSFAPGVASMTWTGPAPTITGLASRYLIETGDVLLLETGDAMLIEE